MIVRAVVQQHADDAAVLATSRHALTVAAHVKLPRLLRADQRLGAHLDGLRFAGEQASAFCNALLERPTAGAVFVLTIDALEDRNQSRLDRLLALAEAIPDTLDGLLSAFGWVERARLRGTVAGLLQSPDAFRRMVGVAACAIHGVDPAIASNQSLSDADRAVRARVFRAAGELGLAALASSCAAASSRDDDPDVQFWAAWSAVLLGNRNGGVELLTSHGLMPGPRRTRAFRLALQAMSPAAAHHILRQLASDRRQTRLLVQGSGIAGDPAYVPWLINQMSDPSTARLAGEAFTIVTGVDLGVAALDRPGPENFESGPNDNAGDPNVDMDPDDGLPWPDPEKIKTWWAVNSGRFHPGTRHFMGAPVSRAHCIGVLKNGGQRQRILAAHYLCLLEPGTPLFNTSAPAWRQQQLVARMG